MYVLHDIGHIGGGRKFWDGSGGSGAALVHYEETGKHTILLKKIVRVIIVSVKFYNCFATTCRQDISTLCEAGYYHPTWS